MATDSNKNTAATTLSDGAIIDRFGGIRPMAAKLGVAFTTVQGWKVRGHIPAGRHQAILDAAAKHGIDLGGGAAPAKAAAPEREAIPVEKTPVSAPPPPKPSREELAQPESAPEGKSEERAKPAPAPEPAPIPAPRPESRSSGGGGVAWLALLVALVVGLALVARPWWEPLVYPAATAAGGNAQSAETVAEIRTLSQAVDRLSGDLAGRLDALDGRIASVERTGGGAGDLGPQLAALERSLSSLASGLESIGATLAGLEARIVVLETGSTGASAQVESALGENATALAALKEELAALKEELATLDGLLTASRTDTDGLREELATGLEPLAALRSRVEELESRPVQTGEKVAALALAIGQVDAVLNSGRPYRGALDRLEAIARDDPLVMESDAIAALSPWADYGIPSRAALQRRFGDIAPDITAALAKTDSKTWADRIWDSVSTIITVRRVEGSKDLSPVSRAEAALAGDDLKGAVAALTGQGSLGEEGNAWLNLAENRIRAEEGIEALYAHVILPLAGATAPDAATGESATQ